MFPFRTEGSVRPGGDQSQHSDAHLCLGGPQKTLVGPTVRVESCKHYQFDTCHTAFTRAL